MMELISSRMRSLWMSVKEENGFERLKWTFMWANFSLMPHSTFRTRVGSWMTKITKGLGHPLHLATTVANGDIALHEDTKLDIEAKCASFAIAEELLLNGKPGMARNATRAASRLHQLGGECAQHTGQNDGIHAPPGWHGVVGDEEERWSVRAYRSRASKTRLRQRL